MANGNQMMIQLHHFPGSHHDPEEYSIPWVPDMTVQDVLAKATKAYLEDHDLGDLTISSLVEKLELWLEQGAPEKFDLRKVPPPNGRIIITYNSKTGDVDERLRRLSDQAGARELCQKARELAAHIKAISSPESGPLFARLITDCAENVLHHLQPEGDREEEPFVPLRSAWPALRGRGSAKSLVKPKAPAPNCGRPKDEPKAAAPNRSKACRPKAKPKDEPKAAPRVAPSVPECRPEASVPTDQMQDEGSPTARLKRQLSEIWPCPKRRRL